MRFDEIATLRNERANPTRLEDEGIYVGYEHIDQGGLRFNSFGSPAQVGSSKLRFAQGDTIYGKLRPYFRKVAWSKDIAGICSSDFWVFRPRSGVEPRFLFYVAALPSFTDLATASSEGTRMPRANWGVVREFQIPDFNQEDQRAIAETLGALDDKIESNRIVIDRVGQLIDAIASQIDSTLPEATLGEVATLVRVQANPSKISGNQVDHFSLPAFDGGAVAERVDPSSILSNKFAFDGRAVLISRLNPRFDRTWWAQSATGIPALASTEYAVLQAKSDEELAAIWLAARSPRFREELPTRVAGTSGSHQRIRPADLMAVPIPDVRLLSSNQKQQALSLLHLAQSKRDESVKLAVLRDTLLPELLSGRIRVGEVVV